MKYRTIPETVEAFRFTEQVEAVCPGWFARLIAEEKVYIDRILIDGAVHIRGCSIYMRDARLNARVGDYIIMWPDGEVTAEKPRRFKRRFRKEKGKYGS